MKISDNLDIVISPYTDKDYLPNWFILRAGIMGTLPSMQVEFTNYDDSTNSDEVNVTISLDGSIVVNTTGFIYKRSYTGNLKVKFDIYLLPRKLVYGRNISTYTTLDSIIGDLWTGGTQNKSSNTIQSIFNGCMDLNHEYLTKALIGYDSQLLFSYNLMNEIYFWNWSTQESESPFEVNKISYKFITEEFEVTDNPIYGNELVETQIKNPIDEDKLTQFHFYNTLRYIDEEMGINSIYNNYIQNRYRLLELNEPIRIKYLGANVVELGKLYPINITDQVRDYYRVSFIQINYNRGTLESIVELRKHNE